MANWHPQQAQDVPAVVAPLAAATRDPIKWPFASSSPWNTPLGSQATYSTITGGFNPNGGANYNVTQWSHPIVYASASDPMIAVYDEGRLVGSFRIPANAQPDPAADHHLHVISPDRTTVLEMLNARRSGGRIDTDAAFSNSLTGPGIYNDYHGARAYGGSAIAGLIRKEELQALSIPHAIALGIQSSSLNQRSPNGRGFVWPASSADGGNGQGYGRDGNLFMGSLLAISPIVNIDSLPIGPQAKAIGKALQNYGGYIVDQAGGNVVFYAEPGSSGVNGNDLNILARYITVVSNSNQQQPGGPGTRLAPLAPPIGNEPVPPVDPNPPAPDPPTPPVVQKFDISGKVYYSNSPWRTVADAKVLLYNAAGNYIRHTYTDRRGVYGFDNLVPGKYSVAVEHSRFRYIDADITLGKKDYRLDFRLVPSRR